jgi:hypothetical protein
MNPGDAIEKGSVTAAPVIGLGLVERYRRAPKLYLFGPLLLLVPYLVIMRLTTGNRPEQFGFVALTVALCFWSDTTREFFKGFFSFLVFGTIYDLTHLTEPLVRYLHVHVAEPYHFDKAIFGITTAAGRLTPNEFFAIHHWAWVDFITGTAYIIFVYWAVGFALYLAVAGRNRPELKKLLLQFGWVFCAVNLVGFATYYVYPAAPPWYAATYGFGPPRFDIAASAAAALRWDELTGLHYFAGFYGRSADIFGAIPSLHVAYPMLVFVYGRRVGIWALDVANFLFYLLVCFSAVYLQHHYVLDVLIGTAYALTGYAVERSITRYLRSRQAPAAA